MNMKKMMKRKKNKPKRATNGRLVKKRSNNNPETNNVFSFLCNHGLSLYNFFCLSLTLYFAYYQFKRYLDNEDVSSIVMKDINKDLKDIYTAYTICFEGQASAPLATSEDMYDRTYLQKSFDFSGKLGHWKMKIWKCRPRNSKNKLRSFNREVCIYRSVLNGDKGTLQKLSRQDVKMISEIDFDKAVMESGEFLESFLAEDSKGKGTRKLLWRSKDKKQNWSLN